MSQTSINKAGAVIQAIVGLVAIAALIYYAGRMDQTVAFQGQLLNKYEQRLTMLENNLYEVRVLLAKMENK
jgi:16S rRNA C1402 (ribose-2'-O) methylase RsmI